MPLATAQVAPLTFGPDNGFYGPTRDVDSAKQEGRDTPMTKHCGICGAELIADLGEVADGICTACIEEAGQEFDAADIAASRA